MPESRHSSRSTEGLLRDASIVIPVAAGETSWRDLLPDLAVLSSGAEIFLVGTEPAPSQLEPTVGAARVACPVRWIVAPAGRAAQMNRGGCEASNRFLWFLHADSRLTGTAVERLDRSIRAAPQALHFFNLAFQPDGPRRMRLNALGTWLRSRVLRLPFGDQGLCLDRGLFERLGGYDERAAYGEDHLLVWSARRRRIPLRCTGASIATSARKYRERGWLRTTVRHAWLTARQAIPQAVLLIGDRILQRRVEGETAIPDSRVRSRGQATDEGPRTTDQSFNPPAGAMAVFVKTPGLSPVKTRLAGTIGREAAEEFHRLSAAAVEAVVGFAAAEIGANPFWAVAEENGRSHPLWSRFERVWQGPGELGERLARIYDALIERHGYVIFVGADSPQITPALLRSAAMRLQPGSEAGADAQSHATEPGRAAPAGPTRPGSIPVVDSQRTADNGQRTNSSRFALGRAHDGGFYLFGGAGPIPGEVWRDVPYSRSNTADALARRLQALGPVHEFPRLCDVDVVGDLGDLRDELAAAPSRLPEQAAVLEWIEAAVSRHCGAHVKTGASRR